MKRFWLLLIPFFLMLTYDSKPRNIKEVFLEYEQDEIMVYYNNVNELEFCYLPVFENPISDAISYMTVKANAASKGLTPVIPYETVLTNYKVKNNTLELFFNDKLIESKDITKSLEALEKTYLSQGYEIIHIYANGVLINS